MTTPGVTNSRRLSSTKHPLSAAVTASLILLALDGSMSQDLDSLTVSTLDPIVVTATRQPVAWNRVPNSVERIDANEVISLQARTLPELLRETPGVLAQKTAHGQGSPFIRGFTGYRTLALIDGVRLNNSTFRDGPNQYWNTIDSWSLDSIELVRGQGSVLYGSDAIGGTLNALTRRPDYAVAGSLVGGRVLTRVASAEDSIAGRLEGFVSEADTYGFIFGITGKDYGNLKSAGLGRQPRTGYDEWDIDAKFEYFLNPDTRVTVLHQQVHQDDAWRTHRTLFARSYRGTEIGTEQRRSLDQDRYLTYLQIEGGPGGEWVENYRAGISHQRQNEERYRIREPGDGRRDLQGFNVDTWGTFVEIETPSSIGHWNWGADYYLDQVDSFRNDFDSGGRLTGRSIQGPIADDSKYHLAGVFAQDHLEFGERLDLWLGGRFTWARADVGRSEDPVTGDPAAFDEAWTNGVGSARFLYDLMPDDQLAAFGGVSQGFRAPNLSDLTRLDSARSDEIETPSTGLDPEKTTAFELGLRSQSGPLQTQVSCFYTDIRDLIVGQRTGRMIDGDFEVTKVNGESGHVHGFEAEADYEICESLSLFGWIAWQEGESESRETDGGRRVNQPLSRMMPLSAEAGVRWNPPVDNLWIELAALGAAEQDRLSLRDRGDTQRIPPGGTPGYVIGLVRAGYEFTEGVNFFFGVENITDTAYRVHGSGINGPGRNFILSAEWRF